MRSLLGALLLLLLILVPALPHLSSPLRAEDYEAWRYYQDVSLVACLDRPHLDASFVAFYRPLGDALTWALVRTVGERPALLHGLLLALHALAVCAVVGAARRLLGLGPRAAWLAGALAAVHPVVPGAVLYLDGGAAQLLFGLLVMGSLWRLGAWRDGVGRQRALVLWCALAALCFDIGLLVPVLLVAVDRLLPGRTRRTPWAVLWVVPFVLVLRLVVLGGLGFYGVDWATRWPDLLLGVPLTLGRAVVPVLGDLEQDVHAAAWQWIAPLVLWGGWAAAWWWRRSQKSEGRGWSWLVLLGVVTLLLVAGGADAVLEVGSGGTAFFQMAYRWYAASLVAALLVCLPFTFRGDRGAWWGLPYLALLVFLARPFWQTLDRAGQETTEIIGGVSALAGERPADRPRVLLGTPPATWVGERAVARLFNYGLSVAGQPPFHGADLRLYPVFQSPDFGDDHARAETVHRLARSPWVEPYLFNSNLRKVVRLDPAAVSQPPGMQELVLMGPTGVQPTLGDAASVEELRVGEGGSIQLTVRGVAVGIPRLHVFNRVHPCYAAELPRAGSSLQAVPGAAPNEYHLTASAWQILDVARRLPGELCFLVLEVAPIPGTNAPALVSNVLPVRLRAD